MTCIEDLEFRIQGVREVPVEFTEKKVTHTFPLNDRTREGSTSSKPRNNLQKIL
jgi:hypothetical protein